MVQETGLPASCADNDPVVAAHLPHPFRAILPEGWRVHEIHPDIEVRVVRDMPSISAGLEKDIGHLWAAAQRRAGGRLFNGRVFSADTITSSMITGHWTEFKRIVAQIKRHTLFAALGLRPLAVNGIVAGPNGIVLGRRPADAVYQPGQWQLPPAGSIDDRGARSDGSVDVLGALFAELIEETGMPPEAVEAPRPLAIVEHAGSHVLDLGIALHTGWNATQIEAAHATGGNAEYAALQVIPAPELPDFLTSVVHCLAPQAPVFLARLGLLPGFRGDPGFLSQCGPSTAPDSVQSPF